MARAMDLAGPDSVADVGPGPATERVPYSELPDRSGKWPRAVRIAFIAGSAAALWAGIFVAIRVL